MYETRMRYQGCIQACVGSVLHYIDDFLLLGPPNSPCCAYDLAITLSTCAELGIPMVPEKTEGPVMALSFHGADNLSRNRSKSFLAAHPSVSPQPTQVPQIALNRLTQVDPSWTSQAWRESSNILWRLA